jgi:hypothetical protein
MLSPLRRVLDNDCLIVGENLPGLVHCDGFLLKASALSPERFSHGWFVLRGFLENISHVRS